MHPFSELSVPQGSVGIHWFEQNAYAVKDSHGVIALIDPYFPHVRPAEKFIRPQPPVDESELRTDYVLLTHDHGDHTNAETLKRIHAAWPKVIFIGPKESVARILNGANVSPASTITIAPGESAKLGSMTAHAVYGKPPAGDPAAGIKPPDVTHLGYVLETEAARLYFSGDIIRTFAEHDDLTSPVAALKPDIGFLTTHPTEGEFPFFDGSVQMARKIGLKTAVPSHYACFVKRTFDPKDWAALFPTDGPKPLIIPWNSHILYP